MKLIALCTIFAAAGRVAPGGLFSVDTEDEGRNLIKRDFAREATAAELAALGDGEAEAVAAAEAAAAAAEAEAKAKAEAEAKAQAEAAAKAEAAAAAKAAKAAAADKK